MDFVHVLSIIAAIIFVGVALFQVLLSLGLPLGEYAMGGYFKVLPTALRFASVFNALTLLFMALIFLQHSNIISGFDFISTNLWIWIITIFLGINTMANLISRSKKERYVMTPLSGLTFLLCLAIALT